ncbi:hypothetical protein B0H13DRAFT_1970949 [Mycena leptocephala]|nr:hypothetical protein B0H13DRAFT_1970949 [Mycena leptocephala]
MRKDISRFICRAEFQILATCGAQDVSPQLDVEASMLYHLFGLRGFPRQRKQCLLEAHTYIVHESIYPRAQLGRLGYVFRRRDIESTTSSSEADIPKKFRKYLPIYCDVLHFVLNNSSINRSSWSVPPQFILAALSVKLNYVVQRPGGRRLARAPNSDPCPISVLEFKSRGALCIAHGPQFLHEYEHEYRTSNAVDPLAFRQKI